MLLIGVNRSPYTRRVAITLAAYRVAFEQTELTGFDHRENVRAANPLGRIPALVLDNGEVLIDSAAIVDHLDETYGGSHPLTPRDGLERRAVLKVAALTMGACDKLLAAAYEGNRKPADKVHQSWIDDCLTQAMSALAAIEAMAEEGASYLLFGRFTQADVTAFVAERLARVGLKIDTEARTPRLHALASRLLGEHPFRATEP